jgi:penicillin-binding protein-related factor A (putative recombinase)
MTEKNLWLQLKKNLPPKTHYQRIENRVSNGMCDTFLCHNGKSVFVELKTTKNNKILLQTSQIAWNMSLFNAKGLSFFLVKHLLTSDLFLFEGGQAIEISEKGLLVDCKLKTKDMKEILKVVLGPLTC